MTQNTRRVNVLFAVFLTLLFRFGPMSQAQGLPFGTRGGGKEEDEEVDAGKVVIVDAEVDDAKSSFKITYSPSQSQAKRRASLVDEFFANDWEDHTTSEALQGFISNEASNLTDFLIKTRRTLHAIPELMYNEKETSSFVQSVLKQLDIAFSTGWAVNANPQVMPGPGGYGIVADIGTGKEPCVLLRADMDALPILERTEGVDAFKSTRKGKMHACGHDGHTTMLLGATALLKSMEESLEGTVRVVFQPAEEGGAGAKRMREEGVLSLAPKPKNAFGIHVWPTLPSGSIASRAGPLLAAADRFEVLIAGVGGHAAMPHLTIDPIVASSAIVMNLQSIVSRTLSPLESGVCSVTKIEGGDAFNVIPASVLLRGTIRALSTETLLMLKGKVEHIVESTASVYGCNVTTTWSPDYYPVTKNDDILFEEVAKGVGKAVSAENSLREVDPTMGAEDFSFIAESIPSTFFLLGQGSGSDPPTNFGLHHPHFALDESVLPRGVELHVTVALQALKRLKLQQQANLTEAIIS